MPWAVVKDSIDYCLTNKEYFFYLFISFISLELLADLINTPFTDFGSWIFFIMIMGYGVQVIEDSINGGNQLPKANIKKIIIYGVKAAIISLFYYTVQSVLLFLVAYNLDFPMFDLEDFFLNFHETVLLFFNHDLGTFIIFVTLGFIISYVIIFFMEISLARLADGGKLRKSFNFVRIKHAIDIIGWDRYAIRYSKIFMVVIIFSYVEKVVDPYFGINIIVGSIALFLAFLVEFRGMGEIYKLYTDTKEKS